jgi:hypothetical protein
MTPAPSTSTALEVFRSLFTRAVVATPANDAVIPPTVTEAVGGGVGQACPVGDGHGR